MRILLLTFLAAALHAQPVAIVNGKPVSEAELEAIKATLPPQLVTVIANKPGGILRYYGFISRMAELAEKAGLGDRSPYREQLALQRKLLLGQAMTSEYDRTSPITPADEQAYFDRHKDLFVQADVRPLFVPIKAPAGAAAANSTGESLWKQIQNGADFATLAKQYPPNPAANPSEWSAHITSIGRYDTDVPSEVRNAIFALKPSQVTPPVVLPQGIYLFRVERITPQPYTAVRGYVSKAAADDRYQEWMNGVERSVTVEMPGSAKPAPPKPAPKQ